MNIQDTKFVTTIKRKRYATPLLVVVLVLGTTDVFLQLIPSPQF